MWHNTQCDGCCWLWLLLIRDNSIFELKCGSVLFSIWDARARVVVIQFRSKKRSVRLGALISVFRPLAAHNCVQFSDRVHRALELNSTTTEYCAREPRDQIVHVIGVYSRHILIVQVWQQKKNVNKQQNENTQKSKKLIYNWRSGHSARRPGPSWSNLSHLHFVHALHTRH